MAGDEQLIADAISADAVLAGAGALTGSVIGKTLDVGRSRYRASTNHSLLQRITNLIHPRNDQHRIRPERNGSRSVSGSVNVDHLPIQAQRIGTGEEHIGSQALL